MRATRIVGLSMCLPLLAGLAFPGQKEQRVSTRSPHGNLNIPCENCHTSVSWKPLRGVIEFDHSKTRYPLRGMHQEVACAQCHVSLVFSNVGQKCADCHADIHRGQFGARCEDCHTVKGWQTSLKSIKGHENRFPLVGAHATLLCEDCHKGAAAGQFAGLSIQCVSCHQQAFVQTMLPSHQTLHFPSACEACHNMDSWQGASFDHLKFTGFALTGVHATLECSACHVNGFQVAGATCLSCHLKDFNGTTNPNHAQAGFPQDCGICHNTSNWTQVKFDHSAFTKFPLTGAHAAVPCVQCHVNGKFAGTPTDCYSCHQRDFQGTTNPNHVQLGFPHDCSVCHTTVSWANAKFNHSTTGFPLTGAHATIACTVCHVGNNFKLSNTACVSCHLKDFNATTNPNHVQAGFPQQCQVCHTTTAWIPASFNHASVGFPLTGAHASVPCASCHINGKFAGTPKDCYSCHQSQFQSTTDPNHVQAGFPHDCSICHNTTSWANANFNHTTFTAFPLTGAHLKVPCASCHLNGVFNNAPTKCVGCHLPDYQKTTDPNHVQAGFPQDCSICHSTVSWSNATFNHATTGFALTGAHASLSCVSCHVNNNFSITNAACVSCHLKDYNGTTNPNHAQAGFPQQCQVCHTTTAWTPASFNHNTTGFPLTGAHVNVPCNSCHINGQFAGTPTDCYSCHKAAYQSTTDPNHVTANFPTNCSLCHTTSSWLGAVFNHTWFPIYSGTHQGVWTTCGDCHINQSNYALFSCITCHTHSQANTDPNHTDVSGYVYNATSCYTCHPTGRGGG